MLSWQHRKRKLGGGNIRGKLSGGNVHSELSSAGNVYCLREIVRVRECAGRKLSGNVQILMQKYKVSTYSDYDLCQSG